MKCPGKGAEIMDGIRTDARHIPAFTSGLIQLGESGKYEGKENVPIPYYRQSRRKPQDEQTEEESAKDGEHKIDLVA